jgi:hypothetical protein
MTTSSDTGQGEHVPPDADSLAARVAALEFAMRPRVEGEVATSRLPHAALFAYATRDPATPVDFTLEKLIRTQADAKLAYSRMLQSQARGFSIVARAASSEGAGTRRVGEHVVRLSGADFIVISGPETGDMLTLIELARDDARVRLALPPSVRGHTTLPLDLGNTAHVTAAQLLADPLSEVYLL